ncbi:MAG: hypothetical protein ACRD1M_01290 [Terriglobales bacterium]
MAWWRQFRGRRAALALSLVGALWCGAAAQQAATMRRPRAESAPGAQQAQAPTRIVSGVTVVDVPIMVLNHQGQPIENLSLDDFELHDDYQKQHLMGFDNQARPVSLAIVVDTSDRASLLQTQRAAQVIADMVVGATGEAAIFIPGPEPREAENFTTDGNAIVAALRHLKLTPSGSDITAPLQLAAMRLRDRPRADARAILVITRQSAKRGTFASALLEGAMDDAAPVFRVYPDEPSSPPPEDPLSPATNGTGVGSSREPMPVQPVGAHGQMPQQPAPLLNLGAIASTLSTALRSKQFSYVYTTGGLDLHAANNGDFDRKLSEVGNLLRSTYHLYYRPDNLTAGPAIHVISVRVAKNTGVAKTSYRHTYVGMRQQ